MTAKRVEREPTLPWKIGSVDGWFVDGPGSYSSIQVVDAKGALVAIAVGPAWDDTVDHKVASILQAVNAATDADAGRAAQGQFAELYANVLQDGFDSGDVTGWLADAAALERRIERALATLYDGDLSTATAMAEAIAILRGDADE